MEQKLEIGSLRHLMMTWVWQSLRSPISRRFQGTNGAIDARICVMIARSTKDNGQIRIAQNAIEDLQNPNNVLLVLGLAFEL